MSVVACVFNRQMHEKLIFSDRFVMTMCSFSRKVMALLT